MKKYIIIHHTAVSYDKNPDQFQATNRYHEKKWGDDVKSSLGLYGGYHYEIAKDGTVRKFREESEIAAAAYQKSMNHLAIHICVDGNFDEEHPTPEQMKALESLVADIKSRHHTKEIHGHRWVAPKTCPGTNFTDEMINNLLVEEVDEFKEWALKHGICSDGEWDEPVTKYESVVMLRRGLLLLKNGILEMFDNK